VKGIYELLFFGDTAAFFQFLQQLPGARQRIDVATRASSVALLHPTSREGQEEGKARDRSLIAVMLA
jgi:hypothetical protein